MSDSAVNVISKVSSKTIVFSKTIALKVVWALMFMGFLMELSLLYKLNHVSVDPFKALMFLKKSQSLEEKYADLLAPVRNDPVSYRARLECLRKFGEDQCVPKFTIFTKSGDRTHANDNGIARNPHSGIRTKTSVGVASNTLGFVRGDSKGYGESNLDALGVSLVLTFDFSIFRLVKEEVSDLWLFEHGN